MAPPATLDYQETNPQIPTIDREAEFSSAPEKSNILQYQASAFLIGLNVSPHPERSLPALEYGEFAYRCPKPGFNQEEVVPARSAPVPF